MNDGSYVCNVCGKEFDELDMQEDFGFDYKVGYGSKYDLTHLQAHICIQCFDKFMDSFIPACKLSPDKGEWGFNYTYHTEDANGQT